MRYARALWLMMWMLGLAGLFQGCPSTKSGGGSAQNVSPEIKAVIARIESIGGRVIYNKAGQVHEVLLVKTGVRDDDLALLAKLPALEILSLVQTGITDAGLVHLRQCRQLREVNLYKSKVTDAGYDSLKAALPGCKIII